MSRRYWGVYTAMPGYMPSSSTICKTKGQALYLAAEEKRQILDATYDVDMQRPSYRASGNIRMDWRIDLEPERELGYSGPDYCITVEPIDEELELESDDLATLKDEGCLSW